MGKNFCFPDEQAEMKPSLDKDQTINIIERWKVKGKEKKWKANI